MAANPGKIMAKNTTFGIGGLVSGVFGIGCASCGTFILSALLGFAGVAGAVAFLPFGGEEFGILGVVLWGFSVYVISKKITGPKICT